MSNSIQLLKYLKLQLLYLDFNFRGLIHNFILGWRLTYPRSVSRGLTPGLHTQFPAHGLRCFVGVSTELRHISHFIARVRLAHWQVDLGFPKSMQVAVQLPGSYAGNMDERYNLNSENSQWATTVLVDSCDRVPYISE